MTRPPFMPRGTIRSLSVIAFCAALVAACTSAPATNKSAATPSAAPSSQPPPATATAPQPQPAPTATQSSPRAAASTAAAAATPGDGLKIIDRKVGSGKEAVAGKAAMVHYTGWLYDDKAPDNKGKQFDTSTKREGGIPFGFIVGVGRVIKGWDQGVPGMKVGGARTLIIPAPLAYGDKDVGNGLIPPNSTLIFDIDLIDVKP